MGLSHEPKLTSTKGADEGALALGLTGRGLLLSGLVCEAARGWNQVPGSPGQEKEAASLHRG